MTNILARATQIKQYLITSNPNFAFFRYFKNGWLIKTGLMRALSTRRSDTVTRFEGRVQRALGVKKRTKEDAMSLTKIEKLWKVSYLISSRFQTIDIRIIVFDRRRGSEGGAGMPDADLVTAPAGRATRLKWMW